MMSVDYGWTHFVWVLAIAFSALVTLLAAFPLVAQAVRFAVDRHAESLGVALDRWIAGLLDGLLDYDAGLRWLHEHPRGARRVVLDRLTTLDVGRHPQHLAIFRRLATDLGLVDLWRREVIRQSSRGTAHDLGFCPLLLKRIPGLGFLSRAESAENLGRLQDQASAPELAQALDDPHPTVRSAAAQALGRIRAPASFPVLVRKLEDAALGRGATLSVRTLKQALAGFDLAYTRNLTGLLQHPDRRVRFLAADVITTMLAKTGHPPQLESLPRNILPDSVGGIFLSSLPIDPNPDVRARAADVIARLNDARRVPALLNLLDDSEWFVRLHATRALAGHRDFPIEALGRRLTDTHWRVREAAARAIAVQGEEGVGFLLAHFRATDDRYSREQVVEELERAGLIPSLVTAFDEPGPSERARFIRGIVRLGRTPALRSAVQNAPEHNDEAVLGALQDQNDLGVPGIPADGVHLAAIPGGGPHLPRT